MTPTISQGNSPVILASGLALQHKLFFSVLLCLIGACQNAATSAKAAPVRAAVSPAYTQGEIFRDALQDGGQGPQMVVLPSGRFRMGSPPGETGRASDEGPLRTVTIGKRIAMGRYEVTFAEYDRFADATGRTRPGDFRWGRGTRPVIFVNRSEARAYAAWLSAQTGKDYRLPTEAEWEYAARAGTSTRYTWGITSLAIRPATVAALPLAISAAVNAVTAWTARRRWAVLRPMPSVCMTCTAMCGSGSKIAGTIITKARPPMAAPGPRTALACAGPCCAAAL